MKISNDYRMNSSNKLPSQKQMPINMTLLIIQFKFRRPTEKMCYLFMLMLINLCHGYHQSTWNLHPYRTPQKIMADFINDLGLKLLAVHNENNDNNIALSPYGAATVLVALIEGLDGDALNEIEKAVNLPQDLSIVRVGLRDIHRHLKTYFIPEEGFLAGLTLNHENLTLRSEYEDVLKFYGYDTSVLKNVPTETTTDATTTIEPKEIYTNEPTTYPTTETDKLTINTTIQTSTTDEPSTSTTIPTSTTDEPSSTTTIPTSTDILESTTITTTSSTTTETIPPEISTTEESITTTTTTITSTTPATTTDLVTTDESMIDSTTLESTTSDRETTNEIDVTRRKRSIIDYMIARYYDSRSMMLTPTILYQLPKNQNHFLVNGLYLEHDINYMTYDTVLPFFYVTELNAVALSFPLDSTRYYLLLLLPIDTKGINQLICDLNGHKNLRYIIDNLRYRHVKAVIPSFLLKGYVVLTPTYQKIGIRRVFEPRQADFSPMTNNPNIYVTNIEQAITVNIRNYVDPNAHNQHGRLQQFDPVYFKADHPFLYFVIDTELQVTLMNGKIINPLNSRIR